jgi:hypothetical protein
MAAADTPGELTFASHHEAASTAFLDNLLGGELEIEHEHRRSSSSVRNGLHVLAHPSMLATSSPPHRQSSLSLAAVSVTQRRPML